MVGKSKLEFCSLFRKLLFLTLNIYVSQVISAATQTGFIMVTQLFPIPIWSMYGIFGYIYHKNQPSIHVGKYIESIPWISVMGYDLGWLVHPLKPLGSHPGVSPGKGPPARCDAWRCQMGGTRVEKAARFPIQDITRWWFQRFFIFTPT